MTEGQTTATRRAHSRRRRGAAILEFVLCIPLLATILGLTFFFGWSMKNQQRMRMVARYDAWRHVLTNDDTHHDDLNKVFFDGKSSGLGFAHGTGPDDTLRDLVDAVGQFSQLAQPLADELVMDRFPRGRSASPSGGFPTDVGVWRKFHGDIKSHHVRDGVEWRRRQASCEETVVDQFLQSLDQALGAIPAPGDGLGQAFRRLYLNEW